MMLFRAGLPVVTVKIKSAMNQIFVPSTHCYLFAIFCGSRFLTQYLLSNKLRSLNVGEGGVCHINIWQNTEENALQQPYL